MVKYNKHSILGLLLMMFVLQNACNNATKKEVWGYAPMYIPASEIKNVHSIPAQPTITPGKIYRYGQWIFQVEESKGIHIIDATQRQNPIKTGFIYIPGCSELSVRQNKLYTNNYRDLVEIDITQPQQISVLHRIENIFPSVNQDYPPQSDVWFECPDASKGTIISWNKKLLQNPTCKRP